MRLRNGTPIEVIDGNGHQGKAILRIEGEHVWLEGAELLTPTVAGVAPVIVEMAALKGPSMEWASEKCVELSVREMFPLLTEFTVFRVTDKGAEYYQERWQRIADQALKQCGRLERLLIHPPLKLTEHLMAPCSTARFWLDEKSKEEATPELLDALVTAQARESRLLVGPEGGWSGSERGCKIAQ